MLYYYIYKITYKDNKVIDKKNIPMFRDIPCNKDIYYANVLIKLNKFEPSFKSANPMLSKYSLVSFLGVNLIRFFKIINHPK